MFKLRLVLIIGIALAIMAALPGTIAAEPAGPRWVKVFDDEFRGPLNTSSVWNDTDMFEVPRNHELQAYLPQADQVYGDVLHLVGQHQPAMYGGQPVAYTSGIVTTYQKFSFKYGHYEIRFKVPHVKGTWSAGWLLCNAMKVPCEIDIFEILGQDPTRAYFTVHWQDEAGIHRSLTGEYRNVDFSADYHTVSVTWRPNSIIWKVDGVTAFEADQGVPHELMFLILNMAIGGDMLTVNNTVPQPPDPATFPRCSLDVAFVKVWSRDVKP